MLARGQKFGRWTVVRFTDVKKIGSKGKLRALYRCRCDCGVVREVLEDSLIKGASVSCGCWNIERSKQANTKHGHTVGGRTPEYKAWQAMFGRCYRTSNKRYKDYGGRGITVDNRWRSYENFFADMGPRPSPRHSLERLKNEESYGPSNCVWALPHDQMTNRRNSFFVDGVPLSDLAREYGIRANVLRFRILKGWPLQEALTKSVRPKKTRLIQLETEFHQGGEA